MSHEHYDITQVLSSAAIEAGSTTAQPSSLFHTVTTHHHSSKTVREPQYTCGLHQGGPLDTALIPLKISAPTNGPISISVFSEIAQAPVRPVLEKGLSKKEKTTTVREPLVLRTRLCQRLLCTSNQFGANNKNTPTATPCNCLHHREAPCQRRDQGLPNIKQSGPAIATSGQNLPPAGMAATGTGPRSAAAPSRSPTRPAPQKYYVYLSLAVSSATQAFFLGNHMKRSERRVSSTIIVSIVSASRIADVLLPCTTLDR